MAAFSERVRKVTTVLLAVFLWLHALFFLNVQSTFISKSSQLLRLTASESRTLSSVNHFLSAAWLGFLEATT